MRIWNIYYDGEYIGKTRYPTVGPRPVWKLCRQCASVKVTLIPR